MGSNPLPNDYDNTNLLAVDSEYIALKFNNLEKYKYFFYS